MQHLDGWRPSGSANIERVNIMLRFIIHGKAQPQERPGLDTRGLFPRFFDRDKTAVYKQQIKIAAFEALNRQWPKWPGPLNLSVREYRAIPSSWSQKKRTAALKGELRPTTKCDLKNLIWLVEDSLNKLAFVDDSQIVSYEGSGKFYSTIPCLEVIVTRL